MSPREALLALKILEPPSDTGADANPRTVADLLGDLASLEAGATGAMAFGTMDRVHGTVLLESGRVCWATTVGMGERLRALVAEVATAPHGRARVDEVFHACLRDKTPLGAALLAAGIVTAASLKAAFKRQTAEALVVMAQGGARPLGWIPRHTHPYGASFTFSIAGLLVAAAAVSAPHARALSFAELAPVLDGAAAGLSFTSPLGQAHPTLVGTMGPVDLELREILTLGRWAADGLARAAMLAPTAPFVSASLDRSTAVIAWSRRFVHVALCTEPSSMAWVMSRLERQRRAENPQGDGEDEAPLSLRYTLSDAEGPPSGAVSTRRVSRA